MKNIYHVLETWNDMEDKYIQKIQEILQILYKEMKKRTFCLHFLPTKYKQKKIVLLHYNLLYFFLIRNIILLLNNALF